MSEAKFTKGEWRLNCNFHDRYGEGIIRSGDFDIAIVCGTNYSSAPMGGINRMWDDGYQKEDIAEHEANAHLIASAPEMYAMLEKLSSQLTDINAHRAADEVERLLAKARGEV